MQPSHILYGFSISGKSFTIYFVCSSFIPPNFICTHMKFHIQESFFVSNWNVAFISVPFSPFLIPHTLFYSLELRTLYVVNAVSNYTLFPISTIYVLFFLLTLFNVNGNILLLVISIFEIRRLLGHLSVITQSLSSMYILYPFCNNFHVLIRLCFRPET